MQLIASLLVTTLASATKLSVRNVQREDACAAQDLEHRAEIQSKLMGVCLDMCKAVYKYPDCSQCVGFEAPDSTPGKMTWDELLEHMGNLADWGQDSLNKWRDQARAYTLLEVRATRPQIAFTALSSAHGLDARMCAKRDQQIRARLQNMLDGSCEEMCKRLDLYPDNCSKCPDSEKFGPAKKSGPVGDLTWKQLLERMDFLKDLGRDAIQDWHKTMSTK